MPNNTDTKQQITTINPTSGKEIKHYEYITDSEVESKIIKCQEAFESWRHVSLKERSAMVAAIGEELQKNKESLAQLMTDEMGKLLKQSKSEIDLCSGVCKYEAETGPDQLKSEKRELATGGRGIVTYSPIGIVYGIQPWNYPSYQVVRYAVANIMAGNGVLLKHASNVTGSAKKLEQIFRNAGLPENLFTVLVIDHDQSDDVLNHELVRGITLTGSSEAGKGIGEKAGAALKKSVLELGSNDAYIILDDADIQLAVKKCVQGRIYNNGETCIAAKRFIAVESVYEEFKNGFVAAMKNVKLGDPNKEDTELGPIAREDLRETLHEQVQESVKSGADVLCGGKMPEGEGFYYPATVLANVSKGQPAYDDELFGPVAALIKAKDAEDAMRIANDSRFGLGGGIFSKNEDTAIELATNHFDTGMIFVNSFGLADPAMPFGGIKNSGHGREHGGFGVREFVNVKSILMRS